MLRIFTLGDSFTEAKEVELYDTYSKVLESLLNKGKKEKRWEVINLGVGGTGTVQQYIRLKNLGIRFQPNLVIHMICSNDIVDNFNSQVRQLYSVNNGVLTIKTLPNDWLTRTKKFIKHSLYNHSNLFWMIRMGLNKLQGINLARDMKTETILKKTPDSTRWDLMKLLIVEINKLLIKNDAAYCLSFVPLKNISLNKEEYIENINRISRELDVPFLDITDDIRRGKYFHKIDGHWNRSGHHGVARALYSRLTKNNLIKRLDARASRR